MEHLLPSHPSDARQGVDSNSYFFFRPISLVPRTIRFFCTRPGWSYSSGHGIPPPLSPLSPAALCASRVNGAHEAFHYVSAAPWRRNQQIHTRTHTASPSPWYPHPTCLACFAELPFTPSFAFSAQGSTLVPISPSVPEHEMPWFLLPISFSCRPPILHAYPQPSPLVLR